LSFKTRNDDYKRSPHESSIRVPTVLRAHAFERGLRIDALVSLIDLPPTLLDAAGIEVPLWMQGHSIMPLVRGSNVDWPDDVFARQPRRSGGT
jgi:arylsulfatase A-like enzyme